MAAKSQDELLDAIDKMTVLELSALLGACDRVVGLT